MKNITDRILDEVFLYRRSFDNQENCAQQECVDCRAVQKPLLENMIQRNAPITFLLPAFPAKSSNREKTASSLPDMGELLSLQFLNELCNKIQSFYLPGASLIICSDGRVFNDLVNVSDANVAAYTNAIRHMIERENLINLHLFNLDDVFKNDSYEGMRKKLTELYAEPLEQLKIRTKTQLSDQLLFNGIHRFIFEDQKNLFPDLTKNKIKIATKEIAYQVIQRSNAWSRLIKEIFPASIRLSIHPQPCGSEKIGIMLLKSKNIWVTPWHSVPVFDGHNYCLMKRNHAEDMSATPVINSDGNFSHYEYLS